MNPILCLIAGLMLAATTALAQDEVPFITTPDNVTLAMLELAAVGPDDHLIDLGSGDGRIVITAARRFGASALGVEIVGDLVRRSRDIARGAGVAGRTEFIEQDLFATDLQRATVITMYLLPDVNLQLRPRLLQLAPGTRIVSHDWDMGDWLPDRTQRLLVPDKSIGLEKASKIHLWTVPAQVQGLWCATDGSLQVTQRFQTFSARLNRTDSDTPVMVFDGRIDGSTLRAHGIHATVLQAGGDRLEVTHIEAQGQAFAGRTFRRSTAAACSPDTRQ